jgi:hypothetical protein
VPSFPATPLPFHHIRLPRHATDSLATPQGIKKRNKIEEVTSRERTTIPVLIQPVNKGIVTRNSDSLHIYPEKRGNH